MKKNIERLQQTYMSAYHELPPVPKERYLTERNEFIASCPDEQLLPTLDLLEDRRVTTEANFRIDLRSALYSHMEIRGFDVAELKRKRFLIPELVIRQEEGDVIPIYLTRAQTPIARERKRRELIERSGMTEQEAESYLDVVPIQLEIMYAFDQGLFGFESDIPVIVIWHRSWFHTGVPYCRSYGSPSL